MCHAGLPRGEQALRGAAALAVRPTRWPAAAALERPALRRRVLGRGAGSSREYGGVELYLDTEILGTSAPLARVAAMGARTLLEAGHGAQGLHQVGRIRGEAVDAELSPWVCTL